MANSWLTIFKLPYKNKTPLYFSHPFFNLFLFISLKEKMNFKDLQFSYNKFKTDVQSQLAKNNPMQKQDTKALSMWIFQERSDLATMRTMAYQRTETNKALKAWVKEEVEEEKPENGRDLEVKRRIQ